MTMITPSYLGETIEYSSLHACRSTLEDPTAVVKSYSGVGTTNVSERVFTINLAQLLGAGEIQFSSNRDVAIVRVEQCKSNNVGIVDILPGFASVTPNGGLLLLPLMGASVRGLGAGVTSRTCDRTFQLQPPTGERITQG